MSLRLHVPPWPFPFSSPLFTFPFSFFLPLPPPRFPPVRPPPPAHNSIGHHLRTHAADYARGHLRQPQPTPTAATHSIPPTPAATRTYSSNPQHPPHTSRNSPLQQHPQHPHASPAASSNGSFPQPPPTPAAARCRRRLEQYPSTRQPCAAVPHLLSPFRSSSCRPFAPATDSCAQLGMTPSDHHPSPSCRTPIQAAKHRWNPRHFPCFRPRRHFEHQRGAMFDETRAGGREGVNSQKRGNCSAQHYKADSRPHLTRVTKNRLYNKNHL